MYSINDSSDNAIGDQENCCKAIVNESAGLLCREKKGLHILQEFQKLYEAKIRKADEESIEESEKTSVKLQIMTDWVQDLREQNAMLVQVVEDLEETASNRVKLLTERLKQSSELAMKTHAQANQSEEDLNELLAKINFLEDQTEMMQNQIEILQSDIRGLLELIRRAHESNCWNINGINFIAIKPSDIPVPLNCSCGKTQEDTQTVNILKQEVIKLQDREKKALEEQNKLQEKLAIMTGKVQSFSDNLNKHAKLSNQVLINSEISSIDPIDYIDLLAKVVENVLVEKNLEVESFSQHLQDVESKFKNSLHDTSSLQIQLEERCKEILNLEQQMANLNKESQETIEALTMEIAEKHDSVMELRKENAALEEQCRHADMQTQFKDDIIKKLRKENKQAASKDLSRKVRIDTSNCPEKSTLCSNVSCDFKEEKNLSTPFYEQQDQIILYLSNTKLLMEKEKEALNILKLEVEKVLGKLNEDKQGNCQQNISSVYKHLKDMEILLKDNLPQISERSEVEEKLSNALKEIQLLSEQKTVEKVIDDNKNLTMIDKMYFEKEKIITIIDCIIKKFNSLCIAEEDDKDSKKMPSSNALLQFKLMEEFRVCTVEAQAATEDIREEVDNVTCTLNTCQNKYTKMAQMITETYKYITKTREAVMDIVNKLNLYDEEKNRYNERIINGSVKLKDIKNDFNRIQAEFSKCINKMQESSQNYHAIGFAEINKCNNMLHLLTDEVEQVLQNLQVFQVKSCCTISTLTELKNQLNTIESTLKILHKNMDETLQENELTQTTFCERVKRLEKLEGEVDCSHTKMQNVLETFLSTKDEEGSGVCTIINQTEEALKLTDDLQKLRKKYNDLKMKMLQDSSKAKFEEKINEWKNQIEELQDQVKTLQRESESKEDINRALKHNITFMEQELHSAEDKAYNYRRIYNIESTEMKKEILELKNQIEAKTEAEYYLKKTLENNEMKIGRTKEFNTETEESYVRNGYRIKHENAPELFDVLQDIINSARSNLQEIENELKHLIPEENVEKQTLISHVLKKLEKYEEEINKCSDKIKDLKNMLCCRDELIENLNQAIEIQKNSISMTQAELKDVHQRLQRKIYAQDQVILQHDNEKKQLIKQNELQIQTIQHLQDAVVEAKRCLDQMGHKTGNDVSEIWPASSTFTHGNVHDV